VFYNRPVSRGPGGDGYGAVSGLRHRGAAVAGRVGAAGMLIRSVGTGAYRLPHTGGMEYEDGVPRIPAAAVTAEDADLMHRLLAAGDRVRVRLRLGTRVLPDVASANVVGEVPGTAKPEEIVLLGAHLDSWDLGTGAIDDGAGCAMVIEAARLIARLHVAPRRTVRVVLFMNEEFGLSGAHAYADHHKAELPRHAAAFELDAGAGRPTAISVVAPEGPGQAAVLRHMADLSAPLAVIRAAAVQTAHGGGADLGPLQRAGVPIVGIEQDMSTYWDWHHTAADTLDKVDPLELAQGAAAAAVLAQGLATSAFTLPRLPPPPPPPAPKASGAR
jgi:hypothetical protein